MVEQQNLDLLVLGSSPSSVAKNFTCLATCKGLLQVQMTRGLYSNINAKKKRIKAGSGERMRKAGSAGAPSAKAFKQSAKTAKKR